MLSWLRSRFKERAVADRGGSVEDRAYTFAQVEAAAAAALQGDIGEPAALVSCSEVWSAAFRAARVQASDLARSLIVPEMLGAIGRDLIIFGESIWLRELSPEPYFVRASAATINRWRSQGDASYTLTVAGKEKIVEAGSVVHVRWKLGDEPGRGYPPAAVMAAELDRVILRELSGVHGYLVPVPQDPSGDEILAPLKRQLASMRGTLTLAETMSTGWGGGEIKSPSQEYVQKRIGADPPNSLTTLRAQLESQVAGACGVPASLLGAMVDGTSQRESIRRFAYLFVRPRLRELAQDLSRVLVEPVHFTLAEMWAADLVGRVKSIETLARSRAAIQAINQDKDRDRGADPGGLNRLIYELVRETLDI